LTQGTQVAVTTSAPSAGPEYVFIGWQVIDGTVEFLDANARDTSFLMPASDVIVYAKWIYVPSGSIPHVVTVIDGIIGTTGTLRAASFEAGAQVTIHAVAPSAGQTFMGWEIEGAPAIPASSLANRTLTFNMPNIAVTATALWENVSATFDVTVGITPDGTGGATYDVSPASSVAPTTLVNISTEEPTDPGNWVFMGWSSDDVMIANPLSESTTFRMPNNDVEIEALWINAGMVSNVAITVTYFPDPGATVGAPTNAEPGDVVVVSTTGPTGYTFNRWTVNGGDVTLSNEMSPTTSFRMGADAVELHAEWVQAAPAQRIVTFVAGSNGSLSGETTILVNHGDTLTQAQIDSVVAAPASSHVFANWTGNPASFNILSAITENVMFTANFILLSADAHNVTFVAGSGGSFVPPVTTPVSVPSATALTVAQIPTPEANTGYRFTGWTSNVIGVYLHSLITADVTFNANFERVHTVTFVAGGNGSLTGTLSVTVVNGEMLTVGTIPQAAMS
jgi:hypothetical protein